MSIRMHAFHVKKEDLWDVLNDVRTYYHREHIFKKASENWFQTVTNQEELTQNLEGKRAFIDQMETRGQSESVELQLFQRENGDYLFRVLERGSLFLNNWSTQGWEIASCFYDNGEEMPEEDEKNKATAEWVDECVRQRKYFIYPIVSYDDIIKWMYDSYCDHSRKLQQTT